MIIDIGVIELTLLDSLTALIMEKLVTLNCDNPLVDILETQSYLLSCVTEILYELLVLSINNGRVIGLVKLLIVNIAL